MKKHTKILCIIIFVFALLCMNNVCYSASDLTVNLSNGDKEEFFSKNIFFVVGDSGIAGDFYVYDTTIAPYYDNEYGLCFDEGEGFCYNWILRADGSYKQIVSVGNMHPKINSIYYSSVDIKDRSDNLVFKACAQVPTTPTTPTFATTKETLASGNFDKLEINPNEFDYMDNSFVFRILEGIELDGQIVNYYPKMDFKLNYFSKYYFSDVSNSYHPFLIPKSNLGISFETGKSYKFLLLDKSSDNAKIFDSIEFTVAERKAEDVIKDKQDETNSRLDDQNKKLDEQNEKLDEQNKTSKSIWDTIKEVLSYINPFSENFFVYKLISLLIDAIKSLFIPSDDFFSNYFTNLKDWFSDRLGFLFYPFELIMDILDKIVNINFSDPVIHIPDINEPFTNNKLISATTFDFNSLLSNSILKNIHDIYLIGVDVVIVIALVNLAKRKWEEVSTK